VFIMDAASTVARGAIYSGPSGAYGEGASMHWLRGLRASHRYTAWSWAIIPLILVAIPVGVGALANAARAEPAEGTADYLQEMAAFDSSRGVMIALIGAIAGAVLMLYPTEKAVVGIGIATALLPPLSALGFFIARGAAGTKGIAPLATFLISASSMFGGAVGAALVFSGAMGAD